MNSRTYQLSATPERDQSGGRAEFLTHDPPFAAGGGAARTRSAKSRASLAEFAAIPLVRAPPGSKLARPAPQGGPIEAARPFSANSASRSALLTAPASDSENTDPRPGIAIDDRPSDHQGHRRPDNRVGKLFKAGKSNAEIVEELFLAAMCRAAQRPRTLGHLSRVENARDRREALEDVLCGALEQQGILVAEVMTAWTPKFQNRSLMAPTTRD